MNIRKPALLLLIIALIQTADLFSQEMNLPELKGFKKVTNYPVYTPDNLWDFINGAADNYLAYGFVDLHVAEYKKGKNTIKLEVYKHKNDVQGFGIYSSERSPGFRFFNIGSQGYISGSILNFFKGSYYVKLRTISKSEKVLQSMQTLALRVADMLPGEAVMPKILSEFPESGKLKNAESYINEGVLGHEFLQGAFKAQYEAGGTEFSVYIFDKDNAEDCRKAVSAYLGKTGGEMDDPSGGKYILKDGYNGDIFLSWKEKRMVIISGLAKDQTDVADRYTSEILH